MDPNHNGWPEWGRYVLEELKRLNGQSETRTEHVRLLGVQVAEMAVRIEAAIEQNERITALEVAVTSARVKIAGLVAIVSMAATILGAFIANKLGL